MMPEKKQDTKPAEKPQPELFNTETHEAEVVTAEVEETIKEKEVMAEALEMRDDVEAKKSLLTKRGEIITHFQGEDKRIALLGQLSVLDLLKGNAAGFSFLEAIRIHPQAHALIPQILYSMSTPEVFRLAHRGVGGEILTYIPGDYTKMMLNIFVPGWSFRVTERQAISGERVDKEGKIYQCILEYVVSGELIIQFENGRTQTLSATGRNPVLYKKGTNTPVSIGNAIKGAETDAEKKAASKLGIGWDVYMGYYSPQAMDARKEAQAMQRKVEKGEVKSRKSPPPDTSLNGLAKIEDQLDKEMRFPNNAKMLETFWAKVNEWYKSDLQKGMTKEKFDEDVHIAATEWLAFKGMFGDQGIVSLKALTYKELRQALRGIQIWKFFPKHFPKAKEK